MTSESRRPTSGDIVVLTKTPRELLDGLPIEDQRAIYAIVEKPVRLNGYDNEGKAELEFTDHEGVIHFLYVSADAIRSLKADG
jgi:hypothetical protein